MLSRTADHLFWMARYMERADNAARPRRAEGKTRLRAPARGGVLGMTENAHAV
jgi:uncharacterized alpha-E superfamily protein